MSCHGGLVAHNIEYDMVSPWELTGFRSFCSPYYASYPPRHHAITPRVCCRLTLAHPALCLPSGAKRSGQAERSGKRGVRGSPPTTTTHLAYSPKKPSATGWLSAAGKGVSDVSSNCDFSQQATRTQQALTLSAAQRNTPPFLGQRRQRTNAQITEWAPESSSVCN
jgi:hypothetical protein